MNGPGPDVGGLTAHLSRGRETTIPVAPALRSPLMPLVWKVILPAAWVALCLALNAGGAWVQAADDHGDAFSTATNLPLGSSRAGRIDPGDDQDLFRLDLTGRSGSTDVWIYTTGDLDTVGWVYDSHANRIVGSDDGFIGDRGTNFHLRRVLPRGVYYVQVFSALDRESERRPTGGYRVHAQAVTDPGSTIGTATSLNVNSLAPGTIDSAGDSDYFRIDLTKHTNLVIRAMNLFLDYEANGEELARLPVEPLAVGALDSAGTEVSVNADTIPAVLTGSRRPVGFYIRDDFGPGIYYLKVTTPAGVASHPVPYTIHAYEDTAYTKLIEDCEAGTRALNNPHVSDPLYSCQWHLDNSRGTRTRQRRGRVGAGRHGRGHQRRGGGRRDVPHPRGPEGQRGRRLATTTTPATATYTGPWSTTALTLPASSRRGTTASACAAWRRERRCTATTTWQA